MEHYIERIWTTAFFHDGYFDDEIREAFRNWVAQCMYDVFSVDDEIVWDGTVKYDAGRLTVEIRCTEPEYEQFVAHMQKWDRLGGENCFKFYYGMKFE